MCLMLGPPGCGKTLLLKRLNVCTRSSFKEIPDAPATIPTVGTNLVNVNISKKQEVTVRELGGCMAPIWHNYYKDCHAVMFMVDLTNRQQISAACIELLTVLSHESLQKLPVLLLLNKMDCADKMPRKELESIIRLPDVIKHSSQEITVMETSAKDGQGLEHVAHWLQRHAKPDS